MISIRNINNQSIFTINTLSTNILYINQMYETVNILSGPPYIIDYNIGSVFVITANTFTTPQLTIINIPTDCTKLYTFSLIYIKSSSPSYTLSNIKCIDTLGAYIAGSSSTYQNLLLNGGTPSITTFPNIIVQSFSVVSMANVTAPSTINSYIRYVISNISNYY